MKMVETVEVNITHPPCHGCGGKGWVETMRGAEICPVCGGRGYIDPKDYIQIQY